MSPENELQKQKKIKAAEDALLETTEENMSPPPNVVAFTEQRSCADLVRMCADKQLDIEPNFQRNIVWTQVAQTRFIDSLLKRLPIPSMCFSLDINTSSRTVIDGLQRTSTILQFFDETNEWMLSSIDDVDPRIKGQTNLSIKENFPEVWAEIQNVMLPVTVIRCDYSSEIDMEYVYMIFHRLNTGAVSLNNQEIRNCIFTGTLNDSIKKVAETSAIKKYWGKNHRFRNEEYVLRSLAFYENSRNYNGRLPKFLNGYMQKHRNDDKRACLEVLVSSASHIVDTWGLDTSKLSKTVKEALLFGIMKNYAALESESTRLVKSRYSAFLEEPAYNVDNLSDGLTSKKKVNERLEAALRIFG